ncbi:sensor histidine kinase [Allonocardiopsis opalescens]|uniref:histidine kinase n=1 Tax=Allonocardiopsis opalescens TaxID=1144618 RepID=A0A2T0Q078_9ACTN|nr:nitrate- and nitrite sensing domain-containing protein [Allonocardiopsis opalescens]PRX97188.1 hypothetical protein CLV72_106224 [Allonocardiopsis opalescens]
MPTPSTTGQNEAAKRPPVPAVLPGFSASSSQDRAGWSRFKLQNWRVRSRLLALIIIPTLVAVVLGGLRASSSLNDFNNYDRVQQLAEIGRTSVWLADELAQERNLVVQYVSTSANPQNRDAGVREELTAQQTEVLTAANELQVQIAETDNGAEFSALTRQNMRAVTSWLNQLPALRAYTVDTRMPALPATNRYSDVIDSVLALTEDIAQTTNDSEIAQSVRALNALARAREQQGHEGAILLAGLVSGELSNNEVNSIVDAVSQHGSELVAFRASASLDQRELFDDTVTGGTLDRAATVRERVLGLVRDDQPFRSASDVSGVSQWVTDMAEIGAMYYSVEDQLGDQIFNRAQTLRGEAQARLAVEAAIIVGLLALVLVVTTVVARSMVRPLRRLRSGALDVAQKRLPDEIQELRLSGDAASVPSVEPIDVHSTDEIGEVARSFDEVHQVALRLAGDEAALRSNVNAMFVNLSRRSQTLVERQLRLIDGLEQGEDDPDRLGSLFKLDHLATRMRRNNENLLVLSGHESARRWNTPISLIDVLRASLSEVEQYERVDVTAQPGLAVAGRVVNDLVHLVAELVENATAFSSHDTRVAVSGRTLANGGCMLEVSDEGIGMAAEELEEANERLANPPEIDVAVSRRMGLFVVGRLAQRHRVHVQLRSSATGGISALVLVPEELLVQERESGSKPPSVIPDTFAEATAAFAASPPVSDPTARGRDGGQAARQPERELPSAERPALPTAHTPPPPAAEPAAEPFSAFGPSSAFGGPDAAQPAEPQTGDSPVEDTGTWLRRMENERAQQETPAPWELAAAQRRAEEDEFAAPKPPEPVEPPAAASPEPWRPEPEPEPLREPERPAVPEYRHTAGSTRQPSRNAWEAPPPTVVPPPPSSRDSSSDRLPIFDSIESDWFSRRTVQPPVMSQRPEPAADSTDGGWQPLAADPAASTETGGFSRPQTGGFTRPERTERPEAPAPEPPAAAPPARPERRPRAQEPVEPPPAWRPSPADQGWEKARVAAKPTSSGTTDSGLPKRVPRANLVPGAAPTVAPVQPSLSARSAERVRSRIASFQQGLRQGRAEAGQQGGPGEGPRPGGGRRGPQSGNGDITTPIKRVQ